jgi:vancomycin resistance protein VanJ
MGSFEDTVVCVGVIVRPGIIEDMGDFTVMTYNVGNGLAPPLLLARALRESTADIIGLEEVTAAQAEAIRQNLSDMYPHQILYGVGIPGKGILSRYPIVDFTQLELHPARPDLRGFIDMEGHELQIIVAHPPPPRIHRTGIHPTTEARQQFELLLQASVSGEPTILLGDFNMGDRQAQYATLKAAALSDAFHEAGVGPGATFPRRRGRVRLVPMVRIDYIWYTEHVRATRAWVGKDAGSDHLPVLAEMEWEKSG